MFRGFLWLPAFLYFMLFCGPIFMNF
uniref:Uncharacterized protein n=1 Tax=Rhizophora mucronata TaxID=61149 RepID=A0A2P2N8Q1_RHIMU